MSYKATNPVGRPRKYISRLEQERAQALPSAATEHTDESTRAKAALWDVGDHQLTHEFLQERINNPDFFSFYSPSNPRPQAPVYSSEMRQYMREFRKYPFRLALIMNVLHYEPEIRRLRTAKWMLRSLEPKPNNRRYTRNTIPEIPPPQENSLSSRQAHSIGKKAAFMHNTERFLSRTFNKQSSNSCNRNQTM